MALGERDGETLAALATLAAGKPRVPRIAFTEQHRRELLAPGDDGALAQLFALLGPTLAEALGPTVAATGVTKKERVDPRSGLPLRNEVAAWAGALGVPAFDLYVGGKDAHAVVGVPGDPPALVIGSAVTSPLSSTARARLLRELWGIVRGSTITRWRDDTTVAAVVVAVCNICEVKVEAPPYAVLAEVERSVNKAIARKVKNAAREVCRVIAQNRLDGRVWAMAALASQDRAAAVAAGDAAAVLADALSVPVEGLAAATRGNRRAEDLLRFVLSPSYLDVRRALGLEGA